MVKEKIIIIGAGPAGLTAAYEILKRSDQYEVIVLEASNMIGGISQTVCYRKNRMDIGGHRFFSKNEKVMEWWKEIMPLQGEAAFDDFILRRKRTLVKDGPDPETKDRVMLIRHRVSRIYYNNKFFDYPISMKPRTFINMGFLQTFKAGVSYVQSVIHKLPETSLENFYINRFGKVLYSMFFEGYTEKVWGRHPRNISADWGAQRVKGLSVIALIKNIFSGGEKETSLIEEFWYPKYGPGQLWESVAQEIEKMGGKILKNTQVVDLNVEEEKISSVNCITSDGMKQLLGDYIYSSMSLKDLIQGMGKNVPTNIKKVADGLPYRDFVTVGLLVDQLELRNETDIPTFNNIVPDCWIYVQDPGIKMGRIQIFNNWSPYMVENPMDTVWIGLEYFCQEGDSFWNMSEEECTQFAIRELKDMGILKNDACIYMSHREQVKKAYPAYFDTYSEINNVIEFLNSLQNLYCIGRNGQHRYNNMDHSMLTAFESVEHMLHHQNEGKEHIWKVNTEKIYHETKENAS